MPMTDISPAKNAKGRERDLSAFVSAVRLVPPLRRLF